MGNKRLFLFGLLYIALIIFIFKAWFFPGLITAGDFWPYFSSMYDIRSILQYAWDINSGNGLGGNSIPFLWIHFNLGFFVDVFGKLFGFSWQIAERISYLFTFLTISSVSSAILFRIIFPKNHFYILASAIYTLNSYILMVVGGGQVHGVAIGYALIPLVVYFCLKEFRNSLVKTILISITLAVQMVFDLRMFYITAFVLFLSLFFLYRTNLKKIINNLVAPMILVLFLHAFWILPFILFPTNPAESLGEAYSSIEAVRFFSFAKFENTIALLHPNWPENIFGKTYFLFAEFLILPVLAFSSILFVNKESHKQVKIILFFVILGLTGIFLAKGANEPFGQVYLYFFDNVPGFQMFRDPTKFYSLIALSYSVLIPYSVFRIYEFLKEKF